MWLFPYLALLLLLLLLLLSLLLMLSLMWSGDVVIPLSCIVLRISTVLLAGVSGV
jgi:hypothetical protein